MIKVFYKGREISEIKNSDFDPISFVKEFKKEDCIFGYSINGIVYDLHQKNQIKEGDNVDIKMLTWDDDESKKIFWHSTAHLLGAALIDLYGKNKLGTGPATDNGFYYDVDLGSIDFKLDQLERIEKKMKELADKNEEFKRKSVTKQEALDFFKKQENEYKCELIEKLKDDEITFYSNGNFTDLCKGPHILNTSPIKFIKLTSISSAYWQGDEKNKQMIRIYGISFPQKELFDEYMSNLEEAKKRNHQIIGQRLKLFCFSEDVGLGLPLWLPRGNVYRNILIDFLYKEQLKCGYKHVTTPHIGNKKLYVISGHYDKYGADSFQPIHTPNENEEFFLKPMNCPHHCAIYKNEMYSYKNIPLRIAEFGTVYRYEQHGEIHGLSRTRSFTQDDAHIFCRKSQIKNEIKNIIEMIIFILSKFNLNDFKIRLSFRDRTSLQKYIGEQKDWDDAENVIEKITKDMNLETVISYGEAAFYGPKIDFIVKDSISRKWQLGTVQLDYNLPQRFDLSFINEENKKERPVLIHRAILGSIERFTSLLLEHTNGNLPLWLSPEQVIILPISEKFLSYSEQIKQILIENQIRTVIDVSNEQISKKIRNAETIKIPYMLILGSKEEESETITVREQVTGSSKTIDVLHFINKIKNECSF